MATTEVYLLGKKYTIKGEAPKEHIQKLSHYIDEKLKEVCGKYPNIAPMNALILTTFNIADEVFKLKEEQEDFARHVEEQTSLLSELFEK